jgi:hypothetical protein
VRGAVIASAAKQSSARLAAEKWFESMALDCFAVLAMTERDYELAGAGIDVPSPSF